MLKGVHSLFAINMSSNYTDHSETVGSLELLYEATDCRDFRALLQAYAEGVDMTQPLPNRVIHLFLFFF